MNKFRSKYTKHIKRNTKMLNKTKSLEKLYIIYLSNPTIENKFNWFDTILGE